ncbi:MAG: membrane protein insertion efficiency factor YidD [Planctomycetota bacterium]
MKTLVLLLLGIYRNTLGLLLADSCRFTPSCSHYAGEAIARRGPLVGAGLALWRIARCNPWGGFGFDPVISSQPPCSAQPLAPRTAPPEARLTGPALPSAAPPPAAGGSS